MARYRIVHWREIPALVEADDGDGTVRRPLSPRFQTLIDAVAMQAGATETEAYLEGWGQTAETERPGAAARGGGGDCGGARSGVRGPRRPAGLARSAASFASRRRVPYNPAEPMKAAELVVACFLLFGACLVWPLLAIANRPTLVLGVPPLVLYLFGLWAAMVLVGALLARRARPPEDEP